MEWHVIGIILFFVFMLLLIVGVPVAFVMMASSLGVILFLLPRTAINQVVSIVFQQGTSFTLLTIPLFMLMAEIIKTTGITEELFDTMKKWFGHFPGGLGMASVAACSMFGAVTGSSIATTVAIGSIAIPEMRRSGYNGVFATSIIAAAGPLGTLIPPSNTGILYGVITETSIGKIFMASVLPGILLTIMFMVYISIYAAMKPEMAPRFKKAPWSERVASLKNVISIIALMILVLGFIYLGISTPSEAAALGCIGALIIAFSRKKVEIPKLNTIFTNIATSTAAIMMLIIGTYFIGYVLIYTDIATNITEGILNFSRSKWVILGGTYVLFILLGMVIDAMAIVCLVIPLLFPILLTLGFDPVWFGVIVIVLSMIGFVSPPVGLAMYVASGYSKDIPLGKVMIGVLPFMAVMILFLVVITAFPETVMWLPNHMRGM
ncbi:MAG: TRAP transporter large permease [Synergistales bacterium]